jgi:exoribonuclease-2
MFVLYEEGGSFKAALIKEESEASLQIESSSGKRSKIKRSSCLFSFAAPAPEELLTQANAQAQDIEAAFLWEVAPQEEFGVQELAHEYFGHEPSAVEKAALLCRLHDSPIYFHRRGTGKYRPAPADILKAALAAQEKKQRQAEIQAGWADQLLQGELPEAFAQSAITLITRADKNSAIWKALNQACEKSQQTPEQVLLKAGAWPHELALHRARFLAMHFPKGTGFAPAPALPTHDDLPLADVTAYSVDDISTTEIDDAISVTALEPGWWRVGIHVAAPALGVTRDSELDQWARERMSTVYTPGEKIPMQPDEVIDRYSLLAGQVIPALSLYVELHSETAEIRAHETRVERLAVTHNLRHNELDALITSQALEDPNSDFPYQEWVRPLWEITQALGRERDAFRGKPENNQRIDYSFYLDGRSDDPDTPVRIEPRQRDAPLDRIVAECMILANRLWAKQLASHHVTGIFRSQQAGRVRMSTYANPHEAIGVEQYAWCTSPLRRYVDLINQRQLIAVAQHGVSAPLVAPYQPRDTDLFAIIAGFEAQYATWAEFQRLMERYWCLRWLQQQGVSRCTATYWRDDLVRLRDIPLVLNVAGLPALNRGDEIVLRLEGFDALALTVSASLESVLAPASQEP